MIAVPHGPENSVRGRDLMAFLKLGGRLGAAKYLVFNAASTTKIEQSDPHDVRSTTRHSSSRISVNEEFPAIISNNFFSPARRASAHFRPSISMLIPYH